MEGYVHSIETFGATDGPGIRFILFLQGCNLRCSYCHNRDSWTPRCGTKMNVENIVKQVLRYKEFHISSGGGITVSGGEPLIQIGFLIELFKACKKAGIHTALDTSGHFKITEKTLPLLKELLCVTDLVLLDIKLMDSERHLELVGVGNEVILDFGRFLSKNSIPLWIRHVLVPEITNKEGDLEALRDYIEELESVERVEILPYHSMGELKWNELGYFYPLKGQKVPTEEEILEAEKILKI